MRGRFAADITGERFGRLVVIRQSKTINNRAMWRCRCVCGSIGVFQGQRLRKGKTRSCGCLQREEVAARQLKHGATRIGIRWPEYGIWRAMINRCYRRRTMNFRNYGGRGISVCRRWRYGTSQKSGFECFIKDMGRRPSAIHSIDRRNNDGNYEPKNCRWATLKQQANNRRNVLRRRKP